MSPPNYDLRLLAASSKKANNMNKAEGRFKSSETTGETRKRESRKKALD